LVDTYDTIEGVKKAIQVGQALRVRGYELAGIRLDSGDLAYLSIEARKLLDDAGFHNTKIVASNDLDEHIVESLKQQGARIDIWGIGTKLVTAFDQPALGGVYKIAALKDTQTGKWEYKIKLSEQSVKVSIPGKLQVKRFYDASRGLYVGDMIYDELNPPTGNSFTIVDPQDPIRRKRLSNEAFESKDLLIPIFEKGKLIYDPPTLKSIRHHKQSELDKLHSSIKRFVNPHLYPAGLEKGLYRLREDLIEQLRPH
jgi:nicotinate phosphoribosyltransferase